jgi:hypothetical protein
MQSMQHATMPNVAMRNDDGMHVGNVKLIITYLYTNNIRIVQYYYHIAVIEGSLCV